RKGKKISSKRNSLMHYTPSHPPERLELEQELFSQITKQKTFVMKNRGRTSWPKHFSRLVRLLFFMIKAFCFTFYGFPYNGQQLFVSLKLLLFPQQNSLHY
ncbi:MAG: hypothetical protein LBS02_00005, partial [Hungatella sp.]|nr:hypothetical protein [Hungatella sp.]